MKACVLALLFSAAWRRSSSLRDWVTEEASAPADPIPKSVADEESGHLPSLDFYTEGWTRRHMQDQHVHEPMSSSIQLVLGVFTIPQDLEYRKVVRRTWLNQTGVCLLQGGPRSGCSVYAAFVMGSRGFGKDKMNQPLPLPEGMSEEELEATHQEPGMFLLDMEENMNAGKSATWFMSALKTSPWATHIAKMDMDVYPFLHKLVHRMAADRDCVSHVSPYEFIGHPSKRPKGNFSVGCARHACDRFPPQYEVWGHMMGHFYALSMPLAEKVPWERFWSGGEDCETTRLVRKAAELHGLCVMPRWLDSWYHGGRWSDPDYANIF